MSDKRYRLRLFTAITSDGFIAADIYPARPETREDELAIEQLVMQGANARRPAGVPPDRS